MDANVRNSDNWVRSGLSFGFLLAENFTFSALALFLDVLRLAADEGDLSRPIRCSWKIMSPREAKLRSSCGLNIEPTSALVDYRNFDYIVVVGGLLHGPAFDPETARYLDTAARSGVPLVGLCTASFILARRGLMADRCSCVSEYHRRDFMQQFPQHAMVTGRPYVDDRDRLTAPGGAGAAQLAALLIERHLGRSVAGKSLHILQMDSHLENGDVNARPFKDCPVIDPRLRRALQIMDDHLETPLPITTVAQRMRMSPRSLERLFKKTFAARPRQIYRRLQLRYARWLIEISENSMTEVALDSGFANSSHFSRHFKAAYGLPPSLAKKCSELRSKILRDAAPTSMPPSYRGCLL